MHRTDQFFLALLFAVDIRRKEESNQAEHAYGRYKENVSSMYHYLKFRYLHTVPARAVVVVTIAPVLSAQ